jgi:L-ribulose-5-phosphate 3-epimerase
MKRTTFSLFILCFSINIFAQKAKFEGSKPINLLDDNFSYWEKWMGNPHTSVTGLPTGTLTGDGMFGAPMGMNDVKGVFKMENLNGEKVLHVSGEIYGGLTTKTQYENYHLQLKYKFGTKKWAPRLDLYKDSGIMFHLAESIDDAFWSCFMMGMEFQIADGMSGDLYLVPNKNFSTRPIADVRVDDKKNWNVNAPLALKGGVNKFDFINKKAENFESPATEWTTLDLYTIGSSAIYMVNGHVVNAFQNAAIQKPDYSIIPLTKGKIQLQSEGAEIFYKDVTLENIADYPADIKKAAGFEGAANWKLGIALFTFFPFSLEEQLAYTKSTGTTYIEGYSFGRAGEELKDSTIMMLSPWGLDKLHQTIQKSRLRMESMYVTGGKKVEDWKRDFEIAKHLKLKYLTCEPPLNMLDAVDSLAGVYGIKVALHNHWKGTSVYWHPDSVLAALKNHPNLGACPDFGHYPKSGINPVDAVKKLSEHIISMHFKDVAEYNNVKVKDVTVGTGVINFPEVFDELKRQNYAGHIMIERDEQDKPNNLTSVNQTIKYYTEKLNLPAFKTSPVRMNTNMRHAGLFNFKATVTEAEKQTFFAGIKDLETILGVQKVEVSRQTNTKTKFEYAFSMEFSDEDIYSAYLVNPKNEAFVKNYWSKMVEDFMVVDTEPMLIATAKKTKLVASKGTNNLPKDTYFAGKWTVNMKGTPEGDVPILMTFQQKDNKWAGSYINQKTKQEAALKSVEVKDDKILVALKFADYDMTLQLNRVDDDHCVGKMVDMFDCEGVRIKE